MIDFTNGVIFKLSPVNNQSSTYEDLKKVTVPGETVMVAFKTVHDGVGFTNKRIIAMDKKIGSGKIDYTSIPYRRINLYSMITAGHFDIDSEIEVWVEEIGKMTFEFSRGSKVLQIYRLISAGALSL